MVGPSGVGKDTLLDGARACLAGRADIVFARREISRPAEAGGEDHTPVAIEAFHQRAASGDYLLHWEAHGLGYGLPGTLAEDLAEGRTVVANVSRSVLDPARAAFPNLRVISVQASPETLAARLAARGREDEADREARLARVAAFQVTGDDVVVIRNDGALEPAVAAMTAAIAG